MAGPPAIRRIAGDIDKIALLTALRADIRRLGHGYGKTALVAFPVGHATLGTYISYEFAVGRVSTECTCPTHLFALHAISSFLSPLLPPAIMPEEGDSVLT